MMSSQPVQSLTDPAIQSRMPLLEGTTASTGLSKPGSMSGFLHKQALQYSGAYYTYEPRVKDGVEFSPPWNNSKTSLLNGRSPVSHLSGTEGKKHGVYRPDNKTFSTDESHSHSPSVLDPPGQHGFTYYTRSPNVSRPTTPVVTAPVAVRNQTVGGVNISPPPENSLYLAFPKPVYGHSPCCSELGCTLGHRYSMEHGPQRMPNILYDGEWVHSTAQYSHPVLVQGKAPETLLQPRSLQLEHNAERQPLKDQTVEEYNGLSPNSTARTCPAYIEPNYSSYPCTPTRTLLGSLTEQQRQHLQISPKGYHGLHLSHPPTYEHMTSVQQGIPSQVYQDRSPMPKYGQLTQRSMFYYPQANMEVESGAVYIGAKHIEDVVPTIHKPTLSSSRGHYLVPQPILSEVPMPSPIAHSSHHFLRGFDHPSYPVHRIHLNASQMRAHLQRPCAPPPVLHANGPGSSLSGLHMNRPLSSPATIHLDQSDASLRADRPCASPPSLDVERQNSYLYMDQPGASPAGVQINRVGVSPGSLSMDRLLDYSQHQARGHAASPRALSQSPVHCGNRIHKAVDYSADPLQMTCSPAAVSRKEHHVAPSGSVTDIYNRNLKRSGSHTPTDHRASPLKKVKEEKRDFFEVVTCKKRQKMEMERARVEGGRIPDSPPMPIIDNVFSLAPYKAYLEASGMVLPAKEPQRADKPSEPCAVKPEPYSYAKGQKTHGQQQQPVLARLAPKEETHEKLRSCPGSPKKEKPALEMLEPKHIKTEKMDLQDKDGPVGTAIKGIQDNHMESTVKAGPVKNGIIAIHDCRESTVKEEVEEGDGSSDGGLMLVVKKCEPDELEYKPFVAVKDGAADECKAGHPPADVRAGSTRSSAKPSPRHTVALLPKPTTPPPPPENKLDLQNIPPQCLKLSTYKIFLPDILRPVPAIHMEKPPVVPIAAKPTPKVQNPVPAIHTEKPPVVPIAAKPMPKVQHPVPVIHMEKPPVVPIAAKLMPEVQHPVPVIHTEKPPAVPIAAKPMPEVQHPVPVIHMEKPPVVPIAAKLLPEVQHPVRQHFFELHQSLCNLVSGCVSGSQEQELRTWVSRLELTEPASPSTKVQKVSCLLGLKAREVWLNEDMKTALLKVLRRLREYIAQEHCPFPHVMRTGAVFIPMLVVKELLFPQVLGAFIDQVLQEHKVELRPTTLSEEKTLTQLHKRACSSKLRRLLSLKHLPNIYADVVNLFYHSCVCKRLGLERAECARREPDEGSDESDGFMSPIYSEAGDASAISGLEPQRRLKNHKKNSHSHKPRRKGRVKRGSNRTLSEGGASSKGEVEYAEQAGYGGTVNTFSKRNRNSRSAGGNECMAAEDDPSVAILREQESVDSWTRPLTADELSLSPHDTVAEKAAVPPHVGQSSGSAKCPATSKNRSGMILKLRRVLFNKGHTGRKARYQAISDPETAYAPPVLEAVDRRRGKARERRDERDHRWMTSKVTHRWQRTGGFSHALRPLTSSSTRLCRSLVKIKYCPYLSACHSAEHRRRWVLRSAVQRARRAMKFYYPDLVGKRVRHLYEEDDKSEVWYRGEVVGVHEAHSNPLKTVFEVRYDSEPEWKYYLELLIDYKKGWLKIED